MELVLLPSGMTVLRVPPNRGRGSTLPLDFLPERRWESLDALITSPPPPGFALARPQEVRLHTWPGGHAHMAAFRGKLYLSLNREGLTVTEADRLMAAALGCPDLHAALAALGGAEW